jgi:hypothetical protein
MSRSGSPGKTRTKGEGSEELARKPGREGGESVADVCGVSKIGLSGKGICRAGEGDD